MMMFVLLITILAFGTFVVLALAFSGKGHDFSNQLAAIDAAAGVTEDRDHNILRRLLDNNHRNKIEGKLQEAGWYKVTPQAMVMRSVGTGVVGLVLAILFLIVLKQTSILYVLISAMLAICSAYYPYYQLNHAIELRKKEVQRTLPDLLDLLSTTVEAGTALNAAIATSADGLQGALGDELRAALHDIRLGRSRAEALAAMAHRVRVPDLTTIVTAIIQSERLGANISAMLQQLAQESREKRILHAEEIAATLSNKLVFPMALCMLPALMIMIFGGIVVRFITHR